MSFIGTTLFWPRHIRLSHQPIVQTAGVRRASDDLCLAGAVVVPEGQVDLNFEEYNLAQSRGGTGKRMPQCFLMWIKTRQVLIL
ncbi:Autophagy-Related Protein 2-like B [Manis pentadactyla]|nr:Autophagy-Related Protein 2-like B [Manis pentadactyla]